MSRTVRITPAGHLQLVVATDETPSLFPALATELDDAFGRSTTEGLLALVAKALGQPLPAPLIYWREFAQQYVHAVCLLGENAGQSWQTLAPPSAEHWQTTVAIAPPMQGLEYLTAERLHQLWQELHAHVAARAVQLADGFQGFLRDLNPLWHLVGRVTFHLAENKRDELRPFAFLATYSHRLSAGAKVQHLPLAQALKEHAGANKQAELAALLEPVRRAAADSALVRELLDSKAIFQPQAWTIAQAYRFLTEVPRLENAGLVVRVPNWWNARQPPRPQVQVRIGANPAGVLNLDGMLDFSVELALDGEPLSEAERRQILQANTGLMLLRGRWIEVNSEQLQGALKHWEELQAENAQGLDFIQGMRLLAGAALEDKEDSRATHVADWAQVVAGDWLRDTLQTLRDPARVTAFQPGTELRATLRPYQADGVRWLWFMAKLRLGGCLADDMGLGKTIQIIDLILHLKKATAAGAGFSALLIVPASLVGNWKNEIERFAPDLRVLYAHRSECDAVTLAQLETDPKAALKHRDIVVTTYGLVRRLAWLEKMTWNLVVLDEAQAIKNASSAQARAVKKIAAPVRFALTGTPVENQLGDLWSIFDFCCPGLLGSAAQFKAYVKRLSKQQDAAAYGALRRLVRPYILRRMKTDPNIAPDLPDKTEMRTDCGLSKKQATLYEQAIAELESRLRQADGIARRGLVLATLMQLKQLCNHPAQFLQQGAFAAADSGKFQRLEQVAEAIHARQEKVLVFTQFQTLCQPLADFLATIFQTTGLILHGQTPVAKRKDLVRRFQAEDGPPFFVVSLKAGGSGLNLTAAAHVVHFDRWWNPAVENQATDRAFRIGQTRNVLVHKFVCRGTVEERIDQLIANKQNLADQLLNQGAESALTEMNDDELLRFVALDLNRATAED